MVKTQTWFPDDTKKSFNSQRPQQNRPQGGPKPRREEPKEPDFSLIGSKVRIYLLSSIHEPLEGTLINVSKYQLVVEIDRKHNPNTVIYKHAVERIEPLA